MESKQLILKHANVIFTELSDKGFGRSITVDISDPETLAAVESWAKDQGVKPRIKDYTGKDGKTVKQFTIRLTEYTQIEGKDGLNEKALGYGAIVNVKVRAFEYNNKFGKGKSSSAAGIFIVEPKTDTVMSDISE